MMVGKVLGGLGRWEGKGINNVQILILRNTYNLQKSTYKFIFVNNLKISTIIEGRLYAISWESADCFETTLDLFTDAEYLFNYFSSYKQQLSKFFKIDSIEETVSNTIDEIIKLSNDIVDCAEQDDDQLEKLDTLFEPLHSISTRRNYHQYKAKSEHPASWIRVYAIRLEDAYIITGSGLKMVRAMQEDELLSKEKIKLDQVDEFCKTHGILNKDGIEEYQNED